MNKKTAYELRDELMNDFWSLWDRELKPKEDCPRCLMVNTVLQFCTPCIVGFAVEALRKDINKLNGPVD